VSLNSRVCAGIKGKQDKNAAIPHGINADAKQGHWIVRPSDTIPGCWSSKIELIFLSNQIEYRTIHSNSGGEFRKSDII
jgi:hypothetical protein